MNLLSTVVVVHDHAVPEVRELLALCTLDLDLLRTRVQWASVDEVVGSSSTLRCQVCILLDDESAGTRLAVLQRDDGEDALAMHGTSACVEARRAAGS